MAVPSCTTRVCKPGSVIDSHLSKPAIAHRFQPPPWSGRANLLLLHGVAPDRVYIVEPISLWAGCALTAPFHPCLPERQAVYLCCTCPRVTPGGRYPLSLPYGARTFLTRSPLGLRPRLSDPVAKILYCKKSNLSNILQNLLFMYILNIKHRCRKEELQCIMMNISTPYGERRF